MRILLVEDQKELSRALEKMLTKDGYDVDAVYDGADGSAYALTGLYDLIILDVIMPKKNGFEVLSDIRRKGIEAPVLMLTALGDEKDKIVQLTEDQTYVQYLLNQGKIDEQEKLTSKDRHALMNFIGQNKDIHYALDIYKNEAKTIILCSDGLYNNASEQQIFSVLDSSERLDQKISSLIGVANANGGSDNIAISIWEPYKHD